MDQNSSNLDAAGRAGIALGDGRRVDVAAVLLAPGIERDAVIRATFRQHPFPGNVLYWLSRGNLRRNGRFYRLEPLAEGPGAAVGPEDSTSTPGEPVAPSG